MTIAEESAARLGWSGTMQDIHASTRAYEAWLKERLGREFVQADLDRKHEKMREGPFPFLRGTFWRFAETVLTTCPNLADAPELLAIGDTHLENFGTWRDAEGRLVWGVNDFVPPARRCMFRLDLKGTGREKRARFRPFSPPAQKEDETAHSRDRASGRLSSDASEKPASINKPAGDLGHKPSCLR
jgi:hypothetical protein